MCDNSSACGCHRASGASAAGDIGAGIVKGVFAIIGACIALTLIAGVLRLVLPWLAGGLAVVFGVVCTTAVAVTARRRRRLRRLVPAPLPSAARTVVTGVSVRAIGRPQAPPVLAPSRAVTAPSASRRTGVPGEALLHGDLLRPCSQRPAHPPPA